MSEHEHDQETPEEGDEQEERASLLGMGWDILVGGKENLAATGGADPFDQGSATRGRGEPGPWSDDEEVDEILEGANIPDRGHGTGGEAMPPEAFWDRGRGAEHPEPSPLPGGVAEATPRDLRPEDLGYRPSAFDVHETRTRGGPHPEAEDMPAAEPALPIGPAPGAGQPPAPEPPRDLSPDDPFFAGEVTPSAEPPWSLPVEAERRARELDRELGTGPLALTEPPPVSMTAPVVEPPKETTPMADMPEPIEELPGEPPTPSREAPPRPIAAASSEAEAPLPAPGLSEGVTVTPVGKPSPEFEEEPLTPVEAEPVTPGMVSGLGEPVMPIPGPESGPIYPPAADVPTPVAPAQPPWAIPQESRTRGAGGAIADPFAPGEPWGALSTAPVPAVEEEKEEELLPDERIGAMLLTNARIKALWEEINQTYDLVVNDVRGHFDTTEQAIDDLKKARELLLSGTENFDNAEELVMGVKARLRLGEKVREWSRTTGTWLAVYLLIWLVILVPLALLFLAALRFESFSIPWAVPDWLAAILLPGLFGGMGGVVGALWVLIEHTARKRDFDPIHTSWYVTNPFMGFALGEVTYLVVWGGGFILTNVAGVGGELDLFGGSIFLYMVCVIVGFNQNVLWEMIDRVVHALRPAEREQELTGGGPGTSEPSGPSG